VRRDFPQNLAPHRTIFSGKPSSEEVEVSVSVLDMSMSLDGYIAGPNDRPGNPGGDGFARSTNGASPRIRRVSGRKGPPASC